MSEEVKNPGVYDAGSITVLEGLEGVRKRPAMYIGSTSINGLHHLVYEVVDNSVDEALAGFCSQIDIQLHTDGSCSVKDNGRGIPTDIHKTEKVSAAEVVMTKLHAGGKFNKNSYKYSGGLHGVGVSVVNALSSQLYLHIAHDGKSYEQEYRRGKPVYKLKQIGDSSERGTTVRFWPDSEIFSVLEFNFDVLAARFREISFLNKGLRINIMSHITGQQESFYFEGGIASFVQHINSKKTPIFPEVIQLHKEDDVYVLDFAFQYNDTYSEQSYSFVNNIRTTEGGTHEAGFKSALTKVCNKYAQSLNVIKDENLSSDDVREGLVSVLSIKVPEPQFEGQTKTKLGNSEVKGVVDSWIYSFLDVFFEENPAITKMILQKAAQAQQARLAAKKARDLTRRKNVLENSVLPGKLADCTETNSARTEIYIVEGESAGGSAKQARDRFTQAILPIKGKIINVEKTLINKALSNNEIKDLITAIGCGVGNADFDINKARYGKIIIMTDADVDGSHIRILLLTFFFRYMAPLIEQGSLYIAQPPLYKAKVGKTEKYLKDESELKAFIFGWAKNNLKWFSNGQQISGHHLELALDNLLAYDNELFKACKMIELPKSKLHGIVRVILAQGWQAIEGLDRLCDLLKEAGGLDVVVVEKQVEENISTWLQVRQGKTAYMVPASFFASEELRHLVSLFEPLNSIDDSQNTLGSDKGRSLNCLNLVDSILSSGKEVLTLQRYKGLGEMNPDQLWETTMDPAKRTLLKVSVADAIKADLAFSDLMGDDVEPRRNYIEEHAHFVRNLDV